MMTTDVKCPGCGRYAGEHTPGSASILPGAECSKSENEVLREELTKLQSTVRTLYLHMGQRSNELLH